jgi:RNA polymerase sigma-70 factor (ECF subfamily)
MTDEERLLAYRKGDALAFVEITENMGGGLYAYVQNQVRDEALAADLTQDVWLKLMLEVDRLSRFIERSPREFNLKAYLYTMATNLIRDHWRRERRLVPMGNGEDEALLMTDAQPPLLLESQDELLRCIALRMSNLSLNKQQAFWRTRDGRMTYTELAEEIGVAMETVKDWVKQALRAIRPCREEFEHGR